MAEERAPLLQNGLNNTNQIEEQEPQVHTKARAAAQGTVTVIVIVALIGLLAYFGGDDLSDRWLLRGHPLTAAKRILSYTPVIVSFGRNSVL